MRSLPFLLLFVTHTAQSQPVNNFGIRFGGNYSTVSANLGDFEWRPGMQGAVYGELFDLPVVSLLMELEFGRHGYSLEQEERGANNETLGSVRATTSLDHFSFLSLARLRHEGTLPATPYLVVGPRFDFLARRDPGVFRFSSGAEFRDELADNMEEVSTGVVIGAGAAVKGMLGQELRFEIRYSHGLNDLLPQGEALEIRHRWVDLSLGLAF